MDEYIVVTADGTRVTPRPVGQEEALVEYYRVLQKMEAEAQRELANGGFMDEQSYYDGTVILCKIERKSRVHLAVTVHMETTDG